jgi:hypothetical protein
LCCGFDPCRQRPRGVAVDFGPKQSGWLINQLGVPQFYQMALADTTVEQSLASSAGGTRGRECVLCEDGSPRGGKGWMKGLVRLWREKMR